MPLPGLLDLSVGAKRRSLVNQGEEEKNSLGTSSQLMNTRREGH